MLNIISITDRKNGNEKDFSNIYNYIITLVKKMIGTNYKIVNIMGIHIFFYTPKKLTLLRANQQFVTCGVLSEKFESSLYEYELLLKCDELFNFSYEQPQHGDLFISKNTPDVNMKWPEPSINPQTIQPSTNTWTYPILPSSFKPIQKTTSGLWKS